MILGTDKNIRQKERLSERGSALVYILIAIALLAALTVSFMEPSSQQTSSQSGFRALTTVKSQADTIRSAVQECILIYPNGDSTINKGPITDVGYNRPFPLNPNSTHLPTVGGYRAANLNLANIRCPGKNNGDANQHSKIFSGQKFMPPPPSLFQDWQYYNGADGVFFWTQTNKTDSFLQTSMEKLDAQYGVCEADIIDASGASVHLDAANTISCAAGSKCFRIWFIVNSGASEHQDSAAGCGI